MTMSEEIVQWLAYLNMTVSLKANYNPLSRDDEIPLVVYT